jgi:phospholipase C
VHIAVTLGEPAKLRETGPQEEAKLSEFQEELVQLAAVLNGDHRKDIYPDKLVENMTVGEAAKYVQEAFKKFQDECAKARESGVDEDEIVVCATTLHLPWHQNPWFTGYFLV